MKKYIRYAKITPEALEVYRTFEKKEGSQYIATPITIQALLDINKQKPFKHVLEMGAGIGTLTYTFLKNTTACIDTYEDNLYCQGALSKNLDGFEGRYRVLTSYSDRPPLDSYDLVIVDGGGGKRNDGGRPLVIKDIFQCLRDVGVVFIEGDRYMQRSLIRRELAKKFVCSEVVYEGVWHEGRYWKGGLAIYCRLSDSWFARLVTRLYYELSEWELMKKRVMYWLGKIFS